jgi:hypothetical protein
MTVEPDKSEVNNYIKQVTNEILEESSNLWIIGRMVDFIDTDTLSEKISTFSTIDKLVEKL